VSTQQLHRAHHLGGRDWRSDVREHLSAVDVFSSQLLQQQEQQYEQEDQLSSIATACRVILQHT
jgi:hypothetical protein